MLAGACHADVVDLYHFLNPHLIVNSGYLREIAVVEATKQLVNIHFCDSVRRFDKAVVIQIKA